MSEQPQPNTPESNEQEEPRIGTDEWVAQAADRTRGRSGFFGRLLTGWEAAPATYRYLFILLLLILTPLATGSQTFLTAFGITDDAFIIRIGARFMVFALLAIGLNVVVGYAGLLDLGYVAFYGIAGYLYAYLSSDFVNIVQPIPLLGIENLVPYGLAVPSLLSIPLIILITAGIGWVIGSASLRLTGDYLAIVTLGFGQVFVQLATTATRVKLPWAERPVDLTRGPNGINNLDNISIFGFTFSSTIQYYYLFLVLLVVVYLAVDHINRSRIGRAWRAMQQDELAAEAMGIPTRRMKLLAFAIGAGIAALAGTVDAAWQSNVVPSPRYSVLTLINLYAMVVLGGTGSLPGAVLGAFIFTVLPEALRSVTFAGVLFYLFGLIGLYNYLKPLRRFALFMGGLIGGGVIFKVLINLLAPAAWDSGFPEAGSVLNQIVQGWLVIPENFQLVGNVVTILAVVVLLLGVLISSRWRWAALGMAVYMFVFAWETRLAVEPAATRVLIVGASLVVLMVFRPEGLLGKPEVKVV